MTDQKFDPQAAVPIRKKFDGQVFEFRVQAHESLMDLEASVARAHQPDTTMTQNWIEAGHSVEECLQRFLDAQDKLKEAAKQAVVDHSKEGA